METILINSDLLELVKQGKKITTCRNGIRKYKSGKTILKSNISEDFVIINITELVYCKLKDVTEDMAKDDGFVNKANLIELLESIYKEINDESDITIVHFSLLNE